MKLSLRAGLYLALTPARHRAGALQSTLVLGGATARCQLRYRTTRAAAGLWRSHRSLQSAGWKALPVTAWG
jgi:hypothetical protein